MTFTEKLEARAAAGRNGYVGFAFNYETRVRYDLIARLGGGSAGNSFTATSIEAREPEWVVKDFWSSLRRPLGAETIAEAESNKGAFDPKIVEQEYVINVLLRERLPPAFCNSRLVCAVERFYDPELTRGTIVFPYVEALALDKWLRAVFYPGTDELGEALRARGFASMTELLDERSRLLRDVQRAQKNTRAWREANALLKEAIQEAGPIERLFDVLQGRAMDLAKMLVETVAALHNADVYHSDIKPQNMLLERRDDLDLPPQLRLIDFGISCTLSPSPLSASADLVTCTQQYNTTITYRDPLATRKIPADDAATISTYTGAFDTFSVGKVLQILFDAPAGRAALTTGDTPVVRQTELMPFGMFNLIVAMTGENGVAYGTGVFPTAITDEEAAKRDRQLRVRPTMARVQRRFGQIYSVWSKAALTGFEMDSDES